MGKAPTPATFKNAFALRLRSARIVAGYKTQLDFAKALGVDCERYKKWESGRTPMPHGYVKPACELLTIDANYLFDIERHAAK